jgi:hypothetical protein
MPERVLPTRLLDTWTQQLWTSRNGEACDGDESLTYNVPERANGFCMDAALACVIGVSDGVEGR